MNARFATTLLVIGSFTLAQSGSAETMPPSIEDSAQEPIRYIGDRVPDHRYYDGRLPHAVGVHHYQVYRANRAEPFDGDTAGWTYNHQPMLAYWNDTYYVQYLSNVYQEHAPPGKTQIVTSSDGRHWDKPVVVFPEYELPEINAGGLHVDAGMTSVMHQRMGFYVAPNGKFLTLGFYGYSLTPRHSPNAGTGLGRVVREINQDGSLGPIYFIRYNRHAGWNETNTRYPLYTDSPDAAFREACEALLADKLITLQWWEEDRGDDGFFSIVPGDVPGSQYFAADVTSSGGSGKAFNYYRRPDGAIVGLWKNKYAAISPDDGETWSKISKNRTLKTDGAKVWAQRTDNGEYILVHNQSATERNRYPMTSMTSTDGHTFDDLLSLRNDIPYRRYQGIHKRFGTHYYRGIIDGNGNPPGDATWVTYTVNKEDVWVARIPAGVTGIAAWPISQDFQDTADVMALNEWNIYEPSWAPLRIVADPHDADNLVLEMRDEEPVDYSRIERVLPESQTLSATFRVNAQQIPLGHALNIEFQDKHGARPMRIRLDTDWISVDHMDAEVPRPVPMQKQQWHTFELQLDSARQSYALSINGTMLGESIPFAVDVEALQRLVFRTGPYRGEIQPVVLAEATTDPAGINTEDIPGTEIRAAAAVYLIDDISIAPGID
tara:strand:+ start:18023 stop:20005 length:1983 start_codon:yes stop_codon:yes gene_type:complete